MEPISLIITALGAGAIAATQETAGIAIKDAYEGLKTLIKQRFAAQGKEDDSDIVDKHEKKLDSEAVKALLKEELMSLRIDQDTEIIKLAQELLKKEKPEESAAGKFNAVFQGEVKGAQVGDHNSQTNTFN